ncbi:hypothetical protein EYZ11_006671 [Aspergillus tanneri]|uniref:Uncharacterized protein n=1 Tax=Aspergillus tanneri TaxID=1220188 RepID=A0A4S3JHC9_9EURO|nr:uncharacterized protein ATNIH1004_011206 [Aspergillus tanneri]KAA8642265.1 hypothetical protein ATNIH1004_011206 [Aspergillus tanneri]THC93858.1 hypothetical protein EYZ11_006671 [Aspergillus tanneri]
MTGILHKVKEAITTHGHHGSSDQSHANTSKQTDNNTTPPAYNKPKNTSTDNSVRRDCSVSPRTSISGGSGGHDASTHDSNPVNKTDNRVDGAFWNTQASDDISRFYREVRQSSIGGFGVIHASGSKGPTTTKTFDPHATLDGVAHASSHIAGPQSFDVVNKMDTRVDSDLGGSSSVGAQH